ncbi:hypothetical protein KW506_05970 [Vibrio fluvialis]|nr:hypothetical protein [Vibrio fluvialis]
MSKISTKDIEAFGRVLGAISELCIKNPQAVSDFLSTCDEKKIEKNSIGEDVSDRARTFNVFHEMKSLTRKEALDLLKVFNKTELKHIIKANNLGPTRLASVDGLVEFIVTTVSKRTEDVFLNQEDRG